MHKLSDLGATTQTIPQHPPPRRSVLISLYSLLLSTAAILFDCVYLCLLTLFSRLEFVSISIFQWEW